MVQTPSGTLNAISAVSRGLAEAVVGTGITVNSILPGPTKSRGVSDFVDAGAKIEGKSFGEFEKEFFQKIRPTSLIKRFAAPEEVASLVAYIASPLASGGRLALCCELMRRHKKRLLRSMRSTKM